MVEFNRDDDILAALPEELRGVKLVTVIGSAILAIIVYLRKGTT